MQVKSKVWFEKDGDLVFGIGKSLILKAIGEAGSINKAAKKMNMSYRHAWSYIRSAEKRLGRPLLIKVKGGREGGGAVLTDCAKGLLEKFEKLEEDVKIYTNRRYKEIFL
jgi:molybdate transport system regulatory protein